VSTSIEPEVTNSKQTTLAWLVFNVGGIGFSGSVTLI